jgi:hypothetical protein
MKRKKVRGKSIVLVKWTGSNKTDWIPEVDTSFVSQGSIYLGRWRNMI